MKVGAPLDVGTVVPQPMRLDMPAGVAARLALSGVVPRQGPCDRSLDGAAARLHELPVLAEQDDALLAGQDGRQGDVALGREVEVVGDLDIGAERVARTVVGHQESAAPVDGRVRMAREGRIGHRDSEEFQDHVAVGHVACFLVVDDLARLELPQRRAVRIVRTEIAGTVDGPFHAREPALRAHAPGGGKAGAVGEQHADAPDDSLAQVPGDLDAVREHHLARGVGDDDVACRRDAVLVEAVDQPVGPQHVPVVHERHRTLGRRDAAALVVADFVGLEEGRIFQALAGPGAWKREHHERQDRSETGHQPSSVWSSMELPIAVKMATGAQTARIAGRFPDMPRAMKISDET